MAMENRSHLLEDGKVGCLNKLLKKEYHLFINIIEKVFLLVSHCLIEKLGYICFSIFLFVLL